jgi:hypothetical protein
MGNGPIVTIPRDNSVCSATTDITAIDRTRSRFGRESLRSIAITIVTQIMANTVTGPAESVPPNASVTIPGVRVAPFPKKETPAAVFDPS